MVQFLLKNTLKDPAHGRSIEAGNTMNMISPSYIRDSYKKKYVKIDQNGDPTKSAQCAHNTYWHSLPRDTAAGCHPNAPQGFTGFCRCERRK
jgi:hypothetical protein